MSSFVTEWDVAVSEQTRTYSKNEKGQRFIKYAYTFDDGATAEIEYELIESKVFPKGWGKFIKGSFKGPLTNDIMNSFTECKITNFDDV